PASFGLCGHGLSVTGGLVHRAPGHDERTGDWPRLSAALPSHQSVRSVHPHGQPHERSCGRGAGTSGACGRRTAGPAGLSTGVYQTLHRRKHQAMARPRTTRAYHVPGKPVSGSDDAPMCIHRAVACTASTATKPRWVRQLTPARIASGSTHRAAWTGTEGPVRARTGTAKAATWAHVAGRQARLAMIQAA